MGVFGAFFGCIGDGGFALVCISACRGVIGFKVGTWLCPVREKVRPAALFQHESAKKFALRLCFSAKARKSSPRMPKAAEKRCFQARWANFFAEMPLEGPRWANFFAGKLLEAPRRANFVAHAGAPTHVRSLRCPPCLQWWGFRATRVASRIVV